MSSAAAVAPAAEEQRAWVARVLGYDVEAPAPGGGDRTAALAARLGKLGDRADLRKLLDGAQRAASLGRAEDATTLLDRLEAGLAGAERAAGAAAEIAGGLGPLNMAFRKARLEWGKARTDSHTAIASFQSSLREAMAGQPDFAQIDREIAKLDEVLATLDDRLETTLDRAMNLEDAKGKEGLKREAQSIIQEITGYVAGHPILGKLDANPFMPMTVFATLTRQLQAMAQELA